MTQVRTWAAFDVHVTGVVAATLDRESGQLAVQRLAGRSEEVVAFAATLPGPVKATYEAGPTGFVLARRLEAAGVDCLVCAPGLIPRGPGDRVKTDRRDAERLVRLLAAGELHRVAVPSVAEESLRDLVRAREDLRGDLMRARHRLAKLLLRHEIRFEGPQANWTQAHLGWLAGVQMPEPASQTALEDYRGAVDALMIRRQALEAEIARALPTSPWAETAGRLVCMRGIDTLTAAGLCAEIGDFTRFRHPAQLASYLGVVPSEHSSGEKRRRGPITRSGSQHARRLLVEAAWHYRRPPARRRPRPPPAGRRARDDRPRLEGPATPPPSLGSDGTALQAPHGDRGCGGTRALRLLLGGRDRRLISTDTMLIERGGGQRPLRARASVALLWAAGARTR
jgi:transposase